MKNKTINRIFITAFFIFCLIPSLGMLVFGPSDAAANEVLSSKPKLTDKEGNLNAGFLSDVSDYIGDRFWLRREYINSWSVLNARLLNTSEDNSVVLGKNGVLYYSETLDDYMGIGLTDGQLRSAAENLSLIRDYAEQAGANFVFTVAPDKNSLYPENMPSYIPSNHAGSNAERFAPLLSEYGINYADLFEALKAEPETLYYATDSHWNSKGAALGADVILSTAGIESDYFSREFIPGQKHVGDLYEMLYPTGKFTETDFDTVPGLTFTTASSTNSGKALVIRSSCDNAGGTLVCWRDSFGNALYPFLAESFSTASFYREAAYDLTRLIEEKPDTVIIELVERNIGWLLTYAPVLPSPEKNITAEAEGSRFIADFENGKNSSESYIHVKCVLPAYAYDEGTPGYITVNGKSYEAFVVYSNGDEVVFSVWIPSEKLTSVSAVAYAGGCLTEYPCDLKEK